MADRRPADPAATRYLSGRFAPVGHRGGDGMIHAVWLSGSTARYRSRRVATSGLRAGPFINIIRHGGHYLALGEGTPPFEIGPELDTAGRFDFGGGLPLASAPASAPAPASTRAAASWSSSATTCSRRT